MNLFRLFKPSGSAPVARERLQVLLAHERNGTGGGDRDLIALLREEIIAAISKHVELEEDHIKVTSNRGKTISTLKVDIEIPAEIHELRKAS